MQCLEQPECRVDGVEFRGLAWVVKSIGQHALVEKADEGLKDFARLVWIAGRQCQPAQGNHRVAPPIRKPRVSGDDAPLVSYSRALALRSTDDPKLRCRQRQLPGHAIVISIAERIQ